MADIENGVQKIMVLLAGYQMTDANTIVKRVNEKLSQMASAAQAPTTDSVEVAVSEDGKHIIDGRTRAAAAVARSRRR